MTLRRYAPLALVALAVGCTEVKQEKPTSTLVFATFDSVNAVIPTPNDLALQGAATMDTSGANVVKTAQKNLLLDFASRRGFPADQEVSISIPFRAMTFNASTNLYETVANPVVDPATATASTVALLKISGGAVTPVPFTAETDPLDSKNLKIRKAPDASGSRRWDAGARYVVAVRGGSNGVRTTTGLPVNADQAIALVIPNKDMTIKENQPAGGLDAATAAKLDGVRKLLWNAVPWCYMPAIPPPYDAQLTAGWNPVAAAGLDALCAGGAAQLVVPASSAFGAVSTVFPADEVAVIAAFQVETALTGPVVLVDSGSGAAPLPIDIMREAIPADTTKALDGGLIKPNASFGSAGTGLVTLDGFSTTAMILAQTSAPITASTVDANVKLYRRNGDATWTEVSAIVKQPSNLVSGGFSTTIGLQPAVWAGTFPIPPLAEDTKYAVVVTDGVTGATGAPMVRSTVARLLLEQTAPVVYPSTFTQGTSPSSYTSLLAGFDVQTAAGVQKMRGELDELIADRALTRASIMAAYTFKTQTVTPTSVSLSAAPYSFEETATAALFTPGAVTAVPPAAFAAATVIPFSSVESFYQTTIDTPNGIDVTTGFLSRPQSTWMNPTVKNTLDVLVAAPKVPADTTNNLAPLVIFHHGITRTRLDMAAIAETLTSRGFVVAAIDAPYHGSRSFCEANSDCDDSGADGVCSAVVTGASLKSVPGTCTVGTLKASASGNYFVSGNFFRTRDAIRQDLMDQSALILALARPPAATPWPQPSSNALAAALADIGGAGLGYAIDPTKVYFVGQSLGGIVGSELLATNPRVGGGVLNVAGGTLTDIFTKAPDFALDVESLFTDVLAPLLTALGLPKFEFAMINSANPACAPPTTVTACYSSAVATQFLKTVNVAKWILDPADPINYAAYVEAGLASPIDALATGLGVTSTAAFGMAAYGDTTIPNAFNYELYGLAAGIDQATYFAATSTEGTPLAVPHGFLLSPAGTTVAAVTEAQADAANFLQSLVLPADDFGGTPGTQVVLP